MKGLALCVVLLASAPALARDHHRPPPVSVGVDLGGGYWFGSGAQFDLHLAVQFNVAHWFALGLRPGLLMNLPSPGVQFGLPVDGYLRFSVSRLYVDVIGGLAVLFGDPAPFRAHVAGGLGVRVVSGFSIGVEAGWLQNGAQLLARFSFVF